MLKRACKCAVGLASLAAGLHVGGVGATEFEMATAAMPTEATPAGPFGRAPVSATQLAAQRGGAQVLNDIRLGGVVADNQAIDVVTGNNLITDGAFNGASGMPLVVQNSGSNVLIQNATIVNIKVTP